MLVLKIYRDVLPKVRKYLKFWKNEAEQIPKWRYHHTKESICPSTSDFWHKSLKVNDMFSHHKVASDRKKYKKDHIPSYHPIQKLKIVLVGLYVAVISDFSVAYKVVLSVPVLGFSFIFRQWVDVTLILLATGMMLVAELFNSAIEILCDFVEEREDTRIGVIKDIAAAAAGISIFVWAVTLVLEGSHLWKLLKIWLSILKL